METKKEIRNAIIEKRNAMDAITWQEATEQIAKKIAAHDWFREATGIYGYMNVKNEVGTRLLIEEAWRLGKAVYVPRIRGMEMDFIEISSFAELEVGSFGILEPRGTDAADGADGLMLVPGVAFDRAGNRVGYGKGYYDRYLTNHPHLHKVAPAFDLQLLEKLPAEEEDVQVELIVTESTMISPS